MNKRFDIKKNATDDLVIPKKWLEKTNIGHFQEYMLVEEGDSILLTPSIHVLRKLYIEPTSVCNLNCVTCIRKNWQESNGYLSQPTFNRLVKQMKALPSLESVMFGGFGEPMSHPDILTMVKAIHELGIKTGMTTNGTQLTHDKIMGLFEAGLDDLWVSIDSVRPSKFNEIREGADFDQVYDHLKHFKTINKKSNHKIHLGIAFVVTKDNVEDLSRLRHFAGSVWAEKISISNAIPYDQEMAEKLLYNKRLFNAWAHQEDRDNLIGFKEVVIPEVSLPKMDYNDLTKEPLHALHSSMMKIRLLNEPYKEHKDTCRFIHESNCFIRWDGMVSPCMGLLHDYTTYLNSHKREIKAHYFGDIQEESLQDIWQSKVYHEFREKVYDFDFSPCVHCGGCEEMDDNNKDCLDNIFPTCGGCLWAQGVIQCP